MSSTSAATQDDVLKGGEQLDSGDFASAMLNILEDSAAEKQRLADTQRAVLNILEDAEGEKFRLQHTQKAVLNILDDAADERTRLADTQRAVLNILEDAEGEKAQLQATQKAILNILDDSADEKARLADTQRAVLNILEDIEVEKKKVEQINFNLRDEIAERTRVEEALLRAKASAEDANKELESFNYSVSHDLRAPLRSIDGFSQALLEDYGEQIDTEGKRYLSNVRAAAQYMGQLIEGLLTLSRVSRAELHRERVDVSALARMVLQRLQTAQPGREVEVLIQPDMEAQADPRLVDVILTNLLGNAWKFTSKRAFARIEFAAKDRANPAIFFVRDNGAGFDATYTEKLFGVFQRLHTTKEFEGTGIGLATVHRIVRRHGGRIWAEGQVDEGATFYFTLEGDRG
jgi:signal transduction histidine kinase